nr:penicillin-binding transpeptidase domain-containing protein [Shouchella xiaoxiensis]
MAAQKYDRSQVLESSRGSILDRHGSVLAEDVPAYNVVAVLSPNQGENQFVEDAAATAEALAPFVGMDQLQLENQIQSGIDNGRYQIELGAGSRNLTYNQKTQVSELELPGIMIEETSRRYYPKQTFASHVIGQQSILEGVNHMGLEGRLNDDLESVDGHIEYSSLHRGLTAATDRITMPEDGADVYTTIDTNIQAALEQAMAQVEEEYAPEKMTAIAADPRTGEILAMSNRPSFNPNQYGEIENYLNYAVQDAVEPGSTLKMFTVAAAIEEGVFDTERTFKSGKYEIDLHSNPVNDVNPDGWGEISYEEGFQRSSNVLVSKLVLEDLGIESFYSYLNDFGFGERTGVDLDQESTGRVEPGRRSDAARTSFGQNSTVTPIQMIQAATAIANDGVMMKPYIVKEVKDSAGKTLRQGESEVVGEPISASTAQQTRELLRGVVDGEFGTGKKYNLQGLDVAGKTGTAQIAEGGEYLRGHGQHLYSFMGMAPYEDPKVVLYVSVTKPKLSEGDSGNDPVSLIFNAVMQRSMSYMDLEPSDEELIEEAEKQGIEMPDLVGEHPTNLAGLNEEQVVVIGDGSTIEKQQPQADAKLLNGERVVVKTDGNTFALPDMTGWSYRDVLKVAESLDLELTPNGSGFVTKQDPPAGTDVSPGESIKIEFGSRMELESMQVDNESEPIDEEVAEETEDEAESDE